MNNDYIIKGETLSTIADGIRRVTGTNDELTPPRMAEVMSTIEPGSSGNPMINIDVTVDKGATVYYLNNNKEICSITGTSPKGTKFNINAYCGIIYVNVNKTIWGVTGNYICSTDNPAYTNTFVMFLNDGGTANTVKLMVDST